MIKRPFKTYRAIFADGCMLDKETKTRKRFVQFLKDTKVFEKGIFGDSHLVNIIRVK